MQLGHQAVNCTNGTINWRQIYGDDAFRLKQPIYASDYDRMKKAKEINFEDLTRRATEYAKASNTEHLCCSMAILATCTMKLSRISSYGFVQTCNNGLEDRFTV